MYELNRLYNCDCMELMAQTPDNYFDLAIVDPPYGGGAEQTETNPSALAGGGAANWQGRKRSRFGGRFNKYHISNPDRRELVKEVSDSHRGHL